MAAFPMRFLTLVVLASIALLAANTAEAKVRRGLAWGTNNQWARKIAKGQIQWYHHWQDGPVPEMPNGVDFVPMYWGPKYKNLWYQRKQHLDANKHKNKFILSFNEPDVAGQANLSPQAAAAEHMRELEPLRRRGFKVSSPQIVYNTQWMDSFLKSLRAKGGDVDFMAVHYYGTWQDEGRLEKWIRTVRKKYGKSVWLTEYGTTAASNGSPAQIRAFKNRVTAWMDQRPYVKRVAWLGCFATSNPPDNFASANNGMFTGGGQLNNMAYSYIYKRSDETSKRDEGASAVHAARSTPGAKRHSLQHHKRIIANGISEFADLVRRNESSSDTPTINGFPATKEEIDAMLNAKDDDAAAPQGEAVHCDEVCKQRDALMADTPDSDDPADDAANENDLDD